jgi:hypothetical protein
MGDKSLADGEKGSTGDLSDEEGQRRGVDTLLARLGF